MLRQRLRKDKRKWGKAPGVKYVGIVADARALNVTREHLWRVLEGQRRSPLLARYHALKRKAA